MLSRLTIGYKHIVNEIYRYAHPYLLHRCFEQLFAFLQWDSQRSYYTMKVNRFTQYAFNYRQIGAKRNDIYQYHDPRYRTHRITQILATYRYPSGECYAKKLGLRRSRSLKLPKSYVFTSGCYKLNGNY